MPTIEELKVQLNDLSVQIQQGLQANDIATVARLQQEKSDLEAQINHAEVEGITQTVAASIETFTVGDTTFTLDQLAADEDAAKIIRKGLQKLEASLAEKASAWVTDLQAQKTAYEQKLAERDAQLQASVAQIDQLQTENGRLALERDDALEKRDAAVRQAEEAQAEVTRLNGHLDDLRNDIAVGASNSAKVIEIESDDELDAIAQRYKEKQAAKAKAAAEAKEAAKVRIYDLEWDDLAHTRRRAKRADNDEVFTFGYLEENKYVVLADSEAAARFREELAAKAADAVVQPDHGTTQEAVPTAEATGEPVMPEVPQFQHDETTQAQPTDGLAGNASDTQVVGKTVEERLTELEGRVIELERKAANPQPAVWAS